MVSSGIPAHLRASRGPAGLILAAELCQRWPRQCCCHSWQCPTSALALITKIWQRGWARRRSAGWWQMSASGSLPLPGGISLPLPPVPPVLGWIQPRWTCPLALPWCCSSWYQIWAWHLPGAKGSSGPPASAPHHQEQPQEILERGSLHQPAVNGAAPAPATAWGGGEDF